MTSRVVITGHLGGNGSPLVLSNIHFPGSWAEGDPRAPIRHTLVDTGASTSCLTQRIVTKLKLPPVLNDDNTQKTTVITFANGQSERYPVCSADLSIGDLDHGHGPIRARDVKFAIFPDGQSLYDVIIGMDVLKGLTLKFFDSHFELLKTQSPPQANSVTMSARNNQRNTPTP